MHAQSRWRCWTLKLPQQVLNEQLAFLEPVAQTSVHLDHAIYSIVTVYRKSRVSWSSLHIRTYKIRASDGRGNINTLFLHSTVYNFSKCDRKSYFEHLKA